MDDGLPLVSCIMPTRNRADFALQSIRYFQRQDYPNRELIIVDDGEDGLQARLPDDSRLRYLRLGQGETTAAKRNMACEQARGAIIAQWDDDDWYGPGRLSAQIAPLLADEADITGLRRALFFELDRWAFWDVTPELHRRLFVDDIHGGTLTFRRRFWAQGARYPLVRRASDVGLLRAVKARGGRIAGVSGRDHLIYLRHPQNTWKLTCGNSIDPAGWIAVGEPPLPAEDRAFYAERSRALLLAAGRWPTRGSIAPATAKLPAPNSGVPLVSCIMPTYNRRRFVPLAMHYFLNQDYPNCELIVVDDGDDNIADLVPPDPRIRYIRLDQRQSLGAKRNLACQQARGSIIMHWDDDDWSAPHRVSYQCAELDRHRAELGVTSRTYYLHPETASAWLHAYPLTLRANRAGGTLCYRRALWERSPFPAVSIGEDTAFVRQTASARKAIMFNPAFYVGIIHQANTSWKRRAGPYWHPRPLDELRRMMNADWRYYAGRAHQNDPH